MRGIIAAVLATVTAAAWTESPFAQATVKTHCKGGKTETPRVQLALQPDGEEVACTYTDRPFAYRGESVAPLAYRLHK